MTRRIQPYRRLCMLLQAVVILGLPFLSLGGESAFRFDIPSLRLHFFGRSIWMDEFFLILAAVMFLTFLIVLITLVFGRLWCGWVCPQTVLVEFTRPVAGPRQGKFRSKAVSSLLTLLVSLVVAANLIWYFVPPHEFFERLSAGNPGPVITGVWIVLTATIFLDLAFLRHRFCATVCPYAKMQTVLFDRDTLIIGFDRQREAECMNCMACVRSCPVGIDIREGTNAACIHCAECIDACAAMMEKRKKGSLIGYRFGLSGGGVGILRQNVYLIGSLTLFFLGFFLYLSFSRVELDMTVLPNYAYAARIGKDGSPVNAFLLSVENRGKTDRSLQVRVTAAGDNFHIVPETVLIRAGEYRKIAAYVTSEKSSPGKRVEPLKIVIESQDRDAIRIVREAKFMVPEK